MLIQHPHDLSSVHCGAAAERDDHVGVEAAHCFCALLGGDQGRVRLNVRESGVGDAHFVELIGDRLEIAVFIQERVCDKEGSLLAHDVAQLLQCDGHAASLDIDLFGCSEPKHILSPLGNGLDVEQVLHADVLGNGVAAPGAAAQRERGSELEVIQIADTAV